MKPMSDKYVFFLFLLILPACSIRNYSGAKIPQEQLATIALKRPVLSIVPFFWIFPLNMLTWFAEDWKETSSYPEILVREQKDDESAERRIRLNRFVTVSAASGMQSAETVSLGHTLANVPIGPEKCTSKTVTCEIKDDLGIDHTVGEEVETCKTPMLAITRDRTCRLDFEVKDGRHYALFIRDGSLRLIDPDSRQTKTANCRWGPYQNFYFSNTTSSSSRCDWNRE